jgi:hypothetical protein
MKGLRSTVEGRDLQGVLRSSGRQQRLGLLGKYDSIRTFSPPRISSPMATNTKQQKRAKRAASKAKQNRMVRSGQAVKASAGDSASIEQVFNKAMETDSYKELFVKMKAAQETSLVSMISVFLVDPLLALVLKGHKEEHATDYIVLVFNAYRTWLDGADEDTTMAWLESDEFQEAYIAASELVAKQQQQQKQFG